MEGKESLAVRFESFVRGSLTLMLGCVFCLLAIREVVSGDVFTNVFLVVIGFWFGAKTAASASAEATKAATETAKAVTETAKAVIEPAKTNGEKESK